MDSKVYELIKYAKMSNDINENKDTLNPQNQTNSLDSLIDILATGIIRLELKKQEREKAKENQTSKDNQTPKDSYKIPDYKTIKPQTTEIKKQEDSNENHE